ncbi:BCCT family transporter [Schaalia suimastitidis]|uniref:BCCT family transporter n=1 Tax=Schaalia suimastitidis TaxID=121163 RepID=UPI0003FEF815|nr:BCCT family transporter [Schaalia suimastitidis]
MLRRASFTDITPSLRWPVFGLAAPVIISVAIAGLFAPQQIAQLFTHAVEWAGRYFGSVYMLVATGVLVLVVGLALSRFGRVRLGADDTQPEYSTFSWAAMLFAAGISTDIMFFAVAEPVLQYLSPPMGQGQTVQAAREAVVMTMFHYGLHGWGLYALLGMALAYFAYRRGAELSLRSVLRPVLGPLADGWVGHIADAAALVGGMFGIATSLGVGVVQLSAGLNVIFGVTAGLPTQMMLLLIGIGVACLSALTDISRGIKILCSANVALAGVLTGYVLITGRTAFLIDALVGNLGDFVRLLPAWSLETYAWERPDAWLNTWTLFFWAWWITWAAFVGIFLARISRGRTIRQFVAGTLTIPFAYVVIWVGIFGNSAVDLVRAGAGRASDMHTDGGAAALSHADAGATVAPGAEVGATVVPGAEAAPTVAPGAEVGATLLPHTDVGASSASGQAFADLITSTPEAGLFEMLASRPFGVAAVVLAVVVGVLFYVTSADSGALVMAELSTKPAQVPEQVPERQTARHAAATPQCSLATMQPTTASAMDQQVCRDLMAPHMSRPSKAPQNASAMPLLRIFWAVSTGVLTLAMLLAGGIPVLQSATVVMALPFTLVVVLSGISLVKELRRCE